MQKITIKINCADDNVTMDALYSESNTLRPAILILPGGGYDICAPSEGAPVAEHFAQLGYCCFVLKYSTRFGTPANAGKQVNPHSLFPEPLKQVASAVKSIRERAKELSIDANRIIVMGFSAGGHLAACYANMWHKDIFSSIAPDAQEIRPNACVVVYGALYLTNESSLLKGIYGEKDTYSEAELAEYTAANHISELTPPTFLFHSVTDPIVPSQNTRDYCAALDKAGIVYEAHLFGSGSHAYGAGIGKSVGIWTCLADNFLKSLFDDPDAFDKAKVKESMKGFGN